MAHVIRVELPDHELKIMTPTRLDEFLREHRLAPNKTVQTWYDPIKRATVFVCVDNV
jgi:hypothetical protein